MHMLLPHQRLFTPGAITLALLVGACGGSDGGGTPDVLTAQAVDGYIVGAQVYCDDVKSGGTTAAGRFSCLVGTDLFRIAGGADVGFDETKTEGGTPFVGELKGPGTLAFVTPLSTIAVEMATAEDGSFDASLFDRSVASLAAALGQSDLDLDADPAATTQLRQLNAQINQVLAAFAATDEDYVSVGRVFARMVSEAAASGASLSLTDGVGELIGGINTRLMALAPDLVKNNADLGQTISRVQASNLEIAGSDRPDQVPGTGTAVPFAPVLTIERDETLVTLQGAESSSVSLASFEDDDIDGAGGAYSTVISDYTDYVSIGDDAFDVDRRLDGKPVSLGFRLDATGDDRRDIAVTTSEARLSTDPVDDGMILTLPAGSALSIRSTDAAGTMTDSVIRLGGEHVFSSRNGGIEISFWRIDERLEDEGFGDIVATGGDYRLTAVIGGVKIGESENRVVTPATQRRVETDGEVVTGSGFEGYVTFRRFPG